MRRSLFIVVILLAQFISNAQVFNCNVDVIAPALQSNPANNEIISSLKNAIVEYVNYGYTWTNDKFEKGEQIDVSFQLKIDTKQGDNFTGTLQITSQRPVFNSDYNTLLFNFLDEDVVFTYQRNSPIQYFEGQHVNNLPDIFAFYIYIVLGYDYDSFSFEGGTPYFNKADQIVSICQNGSEPGWKAGDGDNNRFWLIQNLLQPQFASLRKSYYNYHIKGLDKCYQNREECMQSISSSINDLMDIHSSRPSSFNMQLFFNAKSEELIKIYQPSEQGLKLKMFNLLSQLDPQRIKDYNSLKSN
tara:strand:+ start:2077 stop:2979 length:903 start_codon:yes stop_codon:yes gene_type:complete